MQSAAGSANLWPLSRRWLTPRLSGLSNYTRRRSDFYAKRWCRCRTVICVSARCCSVSRKKSGKTTLAALIVIYVIVVLGGPHAEGYCIGNDFDQAQGRVIKAIVEMIQASPLLRDAVKILANRIEFRSTGSTIQAIASEYRGAAGSNPTITVFDELCGYIGRTDAPGFTPIREQLCRTAREEAGSHGMG